MLNPPVEWPSGTALRCCLTFSQHSLIYISRPVQFCYWFISPQYASPLSFRRPLSPVLHSFPSDLQPMLESGNNAKGAQIHLASSKRKTTYHCQKAEWWFYFLCFCVCCAHKQKFLLETQTACDAARKEASTFSFFLKYSKHSIYSHAKLKVMGKCGLQCQFISLWVTDFLTHRLGTSGHLFSDMGNVSSFCCFFFCVCVNAHVIKFADGTGNVFYLRVQITAKLPRDHLCRFCYCWEATWATAPLPSLR